VHVTRAVTLQDGVVSAKPHDLVAGCTIADSIRVRLHPSAVAFGVALPARRVLPAIAVGDVVGDENGEGLRLRDLRHSRVHAGPDVRHPIAEPVSNRLARLGVVGLALPPLVRLHSCIGVRIDKELDRGRGEVRHP